MNGYAGGGGIYYGGMRHAAILNSACGIWPFLNAHILRLLKTKDKELNFLICSPLAQ